MITRLRTWVIRHEALAFLPFVLLSWVGNWRSALLLPIIPLFWIWRRQETGHWTTRLAASLPALVLVAALPLTLPPIIDWSLALPRITSLLFGLAFAFAIANSIQTERGLVLSAGALIAAGGMVAILSPVIAEWPVYKTPIVPALTPFYNALPQLASGLVRGTSRGGIHVNQLAGIATALLPTTLLLIVQRPISRWLAVGCVAAGVAMAGMLVLTQSRSGYLGASVGMAIAAGWTVIVFRPRFWQGWLAGIAAAALAGSALLGPRINSWVSTQEATFDSFQGRLELWDRAILMIRDYPFTGVGPGQFSLVLHRFYEPFILQPDEYVPHAHNIILQIGVDQGLPGLIAAFALVLAVCVRAGMAARTPITHSIAIGTGSGMIGLVVYGLSDAIAPGARGALPIWVLLGLAMAVDRLCHAAPPAT